MILIFTTWPDLLNWFLSVSVWSNDFHCAFLSAKALKVPLTCLLASWIISWLSWLSSHIEAKHGTAPKAEYWPLGLHTASRPHGHIYTMPSCGSPVSRGANRWCEFSIRYLTISTWLSVGFWVVKRMTMSLQDEIVGRDSCDEALRTTECIFSYSAILTTQSTSQLIFFDFTPFFLCKSFWSTSTGSTFTSHQHCLFPGHGKSVFSECKDSFASKKCKDRFADISCAQPIVPNPPSLSNSINLGCVVEWNRAVTMFSRLSHFCPH